MRHTFTRINPNTTYLQRPYRAYQALVDEQWDDTYPIPPDQRLPAEIRHIQRVRPLVAWDHTPEQRARRRETGAFIDDPRLLAAAGDLAVELETRARFLAKRGTTKTDENTKNGHRLEATIPLEIDGFTDAAAEIGLYSNRNFIPATGRSALHLGYLSVHFNGTNTAEGSHVWEYATIGSYMLNLAHPYTAGFAPTVLYGPSLVDGFGLRDMLTFVENGAPDAGLPPQAYPQHVMHEQTALVAA